MPRHSASRAILVCLGCAALALRPVGPIEQAIAWLLAPLRVLGEMAAPVGLLQQRAAAGSGREVASAWPEELELHRELEDVVQSSALPSSSLDTRRMRVVHGEVVGRERGARDLLRVRVEDSTRLEPGQPVVHGDWYVGRVWTVPGASRSTELSSDEIVVELVTAASSRICARQLSPSAGSGAGSGAGETGGARMVVGGLVSHGGEDWLAVHNPSRRDPGRGLVEVFEPPALTDGATRLANGFLLGELFDELPTQRSSERPGAAGAAGGASKRARGRMPRIRPGLDFDGGLYQVLVLVPEELEFLERPRADVEVLDDGGWLSGRMLLRGSPSPWREGHVLAMGQVAGVRAGAAVATGARLFGRVTHAGPFLSAVRSLGDPGFAVAGLALRGEELEQARPPAGQARPVEASAKGPQGPQAPGSSGLQPHVLGRLTGLGRDEEGNLLLRWPATVPLAGDSPVPATLYTGSGEPGIPRGLLIGTTVLPPGAGPHVLRVRQPEGTRAGHAVRVRLPDRALLQGLEGGSS